MAKIYIDSDCKCYTEAAESLTAYDVPFFDGKCKALIEGYRYIPEGETWTRSDGVTFTGEMLSPWKNYTELAEAQAAYENEQLKVRVSELETELAAAKILLGVE